MAFEHEKRQALHLLEGIENGSLGAADAAHLIEGADPALVYFIFTWLRSRYAGHPAADAVLGRIVEVTEGHPRVRAKVKQGKDDPIVSWFEDEYDYRDFSGPEFVALVVEKLEG